MNKKPLDNNNNEKPHATKKKQNHIKNQGFTDNEKLECKF